MSETNKGHEHDPRAHGYQEIHRAVMSQKMSRRVFVQYSATVVGSTSLVASVVLKTDAIGQTIGSFSVGDDHSPYTYVP